MLLWRDRRPKQDTSQKLKGQLDCCKQLQTKRDHLKQDGIWGPTTKFVILSAYMQYEKCIHITISCINSQVLSHTLTPYSCLQAGITQVSTVGLLTSQTVL